MSEMKTWRVPVVWQEMGVVEVVAGSLAEAMEIVKNSNDVPLPENGHYLDDSFELSTDDVDLVRECYNGGMGD